MATLLDPLTLGPRVARNRVVFGPHETNLARRRAISDRHVSYYRRRATGGAGVIVVEEASVHPSDWPYERAPLAADAGPGWAAVAAACHDEGALILAALGHSGGQGSSAYSQAPLWAPSRVPEVSSREVPKWMEEGEIEAVVAGFAAAARGALEAGCDGIEVNAGQHSLVRQFLSGLTNHRCDEWGLDRLLLARQVLQAVRRGAGRGAVVGLRLCCDELAPWAGITPEAAVAIAAGLAPLVDLITVVRGSIYTVSATRPDGHVEPGFNLSLTRNIRTAVAGATAVVAQGSVVEVGMAEAAVADGTCDAVEMTRAQIADADLVERARRRLAPRPCILCNQTCMARDVRNPIVTCVLDPSSGHEDEDPIVDVLPVPGTVGEGGGADAPPDPAREVAAGGRSRVLAPVDGAGMVGDGAAGAPANATGHLLVVGGGVAGLEAARVAARQGHRVTLVERSTRLGGMIRTAARGSGRQRLALAADWLEAEVRSLGVEVRLGEVVTADAVTAFAGQVLLCTGSLPGRRTYGVAEGAVVRTAAEVLDGAALPEGALVVWDPIGGPIGISAAERVRADGRDVALVTPDLIAGNELARSGDLAPANVRLQQAGVAIERRMLLRTVTPGAVHLEHRFSGEARTLPAVALVDAGHRLPDDRLWRQTGEVLPRAGDAVAPRTIYEAILEGRRWALSLTAAAPHLSTPP